METTIEQVVFYNTSFDVDRNHRKFVMLGNRKNEVKFSEFKKDGKNRILAFDPDTRTVHHGWRNQRMYDRFEKMVVLPEQLFNESLKNSEIQEINLQGRENNSNFYLIDRDTQNRIDGLRPLVLLEKDPFVFYHELGLLVYEYDKDKTISTRYMNDMNDLRSWEFVYDKKEKKEVIVDLSKAELPEGQVLLRIPNGMRLDPVGEGLKWKGNPYELLIKFPVTMVHKAEVMAWQGNRKEQGVKSAQSERRKSRGKKNGL